MTRLAQIRQLATLADARAWREQAGEMNSMEYLALIMRMEALRKLENGNA